MMRIAKAHCLFEQSGTFKDAFIHNGIPAFDYDILDDFGRTDFKVDLFFEIEKAYGGGTSLFDTFSKEDVVMAFFPCVRFEAQVSLYFRGVAYAQKDWSDERKLLYAMKLHEELHRMYLLLSKLCIVCIRKGLRLVVENPRSQPHYLSQWWPLKPAVIDNDRSLNGDEQKKPTQYWFVNCTPECNIMVDCQTKRRELYRHCGGGHKEGMEGKTQKVVRSMINPRYANWFVRTYVLTL